MPKLLLVLHSIFLILLPEFDCSQPGDPVNVMGLDGDVLYRTSFELDGDTLGWYGLGSWSFQSDAPPGGGRRSVLVAGGCVHPHTRLTLIAPSQACSLRLRFWAKNLALGGAVTLRRGADWEGPSIGAFAEDTVWTMYNAADRLYCRPGDTLYLEMSSGGIVYSAMKVDVLEVLIER